MTVAILDRDLGIEACTALKETLAADLHAPQIKVDAGKVERVHTAGLQLLLAWWRAREAAGLDTGWTACSDTLRTAATTLGLGALIGLDGAEAQHTHNGEDPS